MRKKLIALMVTNVMLLQILATPVYAIEQIIEDSINEESQLEVTKEVLEDSINNEQQEMLEAPQEQEKNEIIQDEMLPNSQYGGVINDENFEERVRLMLGLDEEHVITAEDMAQLPELALIDVEDFSGLEYAVNIDSLAISYEYYKEAEYDLAGLDNFNNLTELYLEDIHELTNVQTINNMANLKKLVLCFNYEEDIFNAIQELEKINRKEDLILIIELLYKRPEDSVQNIVEELAELNVKSLDYREMFTNTTLNGNVPLGTTQTFNFSDINPWFAGYILNPNSVFYKEDFRLISHNQDLVNVNNENKTITIKSYGNELPDKYFFQLDYEYYYNKPENDYYYSSFNLAYNIITAGDTTEEIYFKDGNLRTYLLNNYDIDGDRRITQNDMINIFGLHLDNVIWFTGLENAINLKNLTIENEANGVNFDFNILVNSETINQITIRNINGLSNISVLNSLNYLMRLDLTFRNIESIVNLQLLDENENLSLYVKLEDNSDNETVWEVADYLCNCDVENVYFEDLYKDLELDEILEAGDNISFHFTDNPLFGDFVLNEESKLYNPNFVESLESEDPERVEIDKEEQTITLKSYENDNDMVVFTNIYYQDKEGFNKQFTITYAIQTIADDETEIEIPDNTFKDILLREHDIDFDGKITEKDLVSIRWLDLDGVNDYTGLELIKNLQWLQIGKWNDYGDDNDVYISLSKLSNMQYLERLHISNIGVIEDVYTINSLDRLNSVEFEFNSRKALLNSKQELQTIDRSRDLNLQIYYNEHNPNDNYEPLPGETKQDIINWVQYLNVKHIEFRNLIDDIDIEEGIELGTTRTFTFDEINPYLTPYIMNEYSVFYLDSFQMISLNEEMISINLEDRTITINTTVEDNAGEHEEFIDINYISADGGNREESFRLRFWLIEGGDHETPINIPDPELNRLLHDFYDYDQNGIITEYDLKNIDSLNINNVFDLTGLEYATNLREFELYAYDYNNIRSINNLNVLSNCRRLERLSIRTNILNIDCSVFAGNENLQFIELEDINEITNVAALNRLNSLNKLELKFTNYGEVEKLASLRDKEGLVVLISLNLIDYWEPISNDVITQIVNTIETFNINHVIFKNIIQSVDIGTYDAGEEIAVSFDTLSPWINYIRNNTNSKLYQEDFILEADRIEVSPGIWEEDSNITIDYENELVKIKTDENDAGQHEVQLGIRYKVFESEYYSEWTTPWFSVNYRLLANGDKVNPITIIDQNLKNLLLEQYDLDGNGIISEYDMANIEELISYDEISDLTGLEKAVNLKRLSLYNTNVTSFERIRNLNTLEEFRFSNHSNNPNIDSTALGDLTNLKRISIDTNLPFDMNVLQNMTKLEDISIGATEILNTFRLNAFERVYNVGLTVEKLDGIEGLKDINPYNDYTTLNIRINTNNTVYTNEDYEQFVNQLSQMQSPNVNVNINNIYIDLGNFEMGIEPQQIRFEDINPIVAAVLGEGPLHTNDFRFNKDDWYTPNNNENATIDYENNKIVLDLNQVGENNIYFQLGNQYYWNDPNENIQIRATIHYHYNVEAQGNIYQIIEIPDPTLRRILEDEYNIDGQPGISDYDMKNIVDLYAYNVKDFTGIEFAANLKHLCIDASKETDLTKIERLDNLVDLEIELLDTEVDLEPLTGLYQLKKLSVYANCEEGASFEYDINPIINHFIHLESLYISYQLENVNLANLKKLKILDVVMPTDGLLYDGSLTMIMNRDSLEDITIRKIDTAMKYENFNMLPNLRNLRLEFKNANAMVGLDAINTDNLYLNIGFYSGDSITSNEEIHVFVSEIDKLVNKRNIDINFNITQQIQNILVNGERTYDYNELSEVLTATENPNSILHNATLNENEWEDGALQLNTLEKTVKILAGEDVGNKACSLRVSKNNAYGTLRFRYNVYTDEGSTTKLYTFNDKNLERVLLEKYNIDGEEGFSERDMLNLTELDLYKADVEDLTGLEDAVNLKEILAAQNRIRSIEPLMGLEKLTHVEVQDNLITDITCLENRAFKFVDAFSLEDNFIDLSNGSENLRVLEQEINKDRQKEGYYEETSIGMIVATQKHGNPDEFDSFIEFGDNRVKQVLIDLGVPNINGEITRRALYEATRDYSENRPIIDRLDLANMELTNLAGLEYLGQIQELDLSNNNISNIEQLKYLSNLKDLNLSNNNITDISALSKYIGSANSGDRNMNFTFAFNQIDSLEPINDWYCLTSTVMPTFFTEGTCRNVRIDLVDNNISSIEGVENWKNLVWLDLANNNISDISNLKDYNFVVLPGADLYLDDENMVMQLDRFEGIQLFSNNIDLEAQGTKDAKAVFDEKHVALILEDDGPHFVVGDVNNDGAVNVTDYTMIIRYLKGYEQLDELQLLAADVNKDGTVNVTDYTKIIRYLKGYETLD